jgi:hypothetical protein
MSLDQHQRQLNQHRDYEGWRRAWSPPEQNGRFQARFTHYGVTLNGGTFDSPAECVQKRISMESELIAAAQVVPIDIKRFRYAVPTAREYRTYLRTPEHLAALKQQNEVCCCVSVSGFLCIYAV